MAAELEQFEIPTPDLEPLKEANLPIIWVLGGPGSGKGTQCDLIVVKYGYTHISTGDLLRADVDSGSARGRMLQKLMKEGILVPTNIVLGLLLEKMLASIETSKGFLIDGFPREIPQAELFEKHIGECTAVLYFEVKDETMIQRLLARGKTSGRADDNEATIRKRLDIFHLNNDPIIKKYASKVKTFSGEEAPREIFAKVADVLEGLADAPAP